VTLALPLVLQISQAHPDALCRGGWCGQQQGEIAHLTLFQGHGRPSPSVWGLLATPTARGGTLWGHGGWWLRYGNHLNESAQTAIRSVWSNFPLPRPMGFFDRLSRLLRANLNDLVSKAEDPAKILDQSLADMQGDLVKLRQAVATAISSQKRLQNQAEQADSQAKAWYQRAEVALQKGEESLAREALSRRKTYQDTATALFTQVNSQSGQVETLKRTLTALEAKIAEARTKKDMLKARAQAAQAQEQLQSAVSNLGTNNAMAAFDQMEEKVLNLEARSQAAAELAGADLESQFAALEGTDVDDELAALKQRLDGGANPIQLPAVNGPAPQLEPVKAAEVDEELLELKRSIDKL
jgi:phage shock protein A